jgi:malic enzyme
VTDEDIAVGRVYPDLSRMQEVSLKIAVVIAEYAYEHGIAINVCMNASQYRSFWQLSQLLPRLPDYFHSDPAT